MQDHGYTKYETFKKYNTDLKGKIWTRLKRFLSKGLLLDINHVA